MANLKHIDNVYSALRGIPSGTIPGLSKIMGNERIARGLAEAMTEGPDSVKVYLKDIKGGDELLENPSFMNVSSQLHNVEIAEAAASRSSREAARLNAERPADATSTTVNASTDPTVIAQQARHTMDGMIRNLDPNVSLQNLNGAGMQGFADDFVRKMKEVNPEFDGLHRLDERGMTGLHIKMNDAMTATGNATEGGSSIFFSRFESAVNTRLSRPSLNSAPIPDGLQVAVRTGDPATDALTGNARRAIGETSEGGDIVTRADNFPANRVVDEAPGPNNRNNGNGGGDEPPINGGDDVGSNAFRGAAGRLPQNIMDQAGDIRAALARNNGFAAGSPATTKIDDFIEGLRTNRANNTPMAEGATTPGEVLKAVENGYQPSSAQITDLKGALDNVAAGRATSNWIAPTSLLKPFPTRQPGVDTYSVGQVNRIMDGLNPNPIANSFAGRNIGNIAMGTVLTASVAGMALPEDSAIGEPGRWINGTIGGIKIPYTDDRIGVNLYQAPMMFSGVFVDSSLDYLENPSHAGEFHRQAVSGVAADRVGQEGDERLKSLTDPRSVTLYALRSSDVFLSEEQQARLDVIEGKIGGVVMSKVLQAETAVAAGEIDLERELAEKDIAQTNQDFINQGLGTAFTVSVQGQPASQSRQASYSQFANFHQSTFNSLPSDTLRNQWNQVEAGGDGINGLSKLEMTTLQTQLQSGTEKIILGEFKADFN